MPPSAAPEPLRAHLSHNGDVRDVVILGATGSIGTQAVDVVMASPGSFRVVGLAAGGGRPELLAEQAARLRVEVVAVSDPAVEAVLRDELSALGVSPKVVVGPEAAVELAGWPCDVVLNGITGSIGLRPTLAALDAGRLLALANKESLIVGGPLVKAAAAPGQIVPVDSEHSALAQALRSGHPEEVQRLVLTASGGPFRGRSRSELTDVTPAEAMAHPTWDMGPVVTINSATLVNKGLEVIEAHLLFDVPFERIDVVVHPQSVVHSMVEFSDGSTICQASPPDMKLPIALGLGWPERVPGAARPCDWSSATNWTFEPLDEDAFPAVQLARKAGTRGGVAPAVFNAANEECVEAFRSGRLSFLGILEVVAQVLEEQASDRAITEALRNPLTLDDVLSAEQSARACAQTLIEKESA